MAVRIEVEPIQPRFDVASLYERLRLIPQILELLRLENPEGMEFTPPEVNEKEGAERPLRFTAIAFDRSGGRAVLLAGDLERPDEVTIEPIRFEALPSFDELREARELLVLHAELAPRIEAGDLVVYQPMPPLASREREDGSMERLIALATFSERDDPPHRRYAIDLANRLVITDLPWLDNWPVHDCEARLPVGVGDLPDAGGHDRVRVRVLDGDTELWNLIVVRPRASAPTTYGKGSGIELRSVHYRGRQVFYQAHVPILNVLYDDAVSYRDWQNQETVFEAVGNDPVGPGWRVCTQPPRTILESNSDFGNFQGVALWYEDGELRLVSELTAGWYRYITDWRLLDNGTIRPRFGFAGTRNPRTCMRHQHHAYWRFDFDIEGAGRDVVEQRSLILSADFQNNLPVIGFPWRAITTETKRTRSWFASRWRVRDTQQNRGYIIEPGGMDGTADAYGGADVWILRYRWSEQDDGVSVVGGSPADTSIKIDKYLTGEWVDGTDVVMWYAGHFLHDEHDPHPHQGHIVGPELRPFNW